MVSDNIELDDNKKRALDRLKDNKYINSLGMEFVCLDRKKAVTKVSFSEDICNPYGAIHGGALYSIADVTGGTLVNSLGQFCVTVNGSLNYLLPVINIDSFYCEANLIRNGSSLAVVEIKITDFSNIVYCDGNFTFFKIKK